MLNKRCTNNQAEQLAILRALLYTENIKTEDDTATIYTDSQMTMDWLKKATLIIPYRRNKEIDRDGENKLENVILLSQGSRRDPEKRVSRHTCKGDSNERGHHRMQQESSKKCIDKLT